MARFRLPFPHPGQIAVRRAAKRFNWLSAGRRWRKTTLAMSLAVESALDRKTIIWGAPTYDQCRIAFDEARRSDVERAVEFNSSRLIASFPDHGKIIYRSLDNADNVRGYTADGVVIDEAGVVPAEAWHEVLRPMLIDTNGWLWAIGTPKGRNWFWQEYQRALEREDSAAFQIPTRGVTFTPDGIQPAPHPWENPMIPFDEIQQLYQTLPERIFRQEILGEFIELSGAVFRFVTECATAVPHDKAQEGARYVCGVDWGRTNDATVFAVVEMRSKSLVFLDRMTRIDYALQRGRLQALVKRFQPVTILAEQNSIGGPVIEELQRAGLPVQGFTTTNATKAAIIQELALGFEHKELRILPDPILIGELQAFESDRLPSGVIRYGAPDGAHDDTVIALALAWHAAHSHVPLVRLDLEGTTQESPWR